MELDCSQKTVRCWLHRFNRAAGATAVGARRGTVGLR
ncbi:hypothetical protein [Streptomyces mirabilis]